MWKEDNLDMSCSVEKGVSQYTARIDSELFLCCVDF